jgi:hypothetical protein
LDTIGDTSSPKQPSKVQPIERNRDEENKKLSQRSTTPVDHHEHNDEHEMDEEGSISDDYDLDVEY